LNIGKPFAVTVLVVSLSQEAMINQKLEHVLQSRGPKPDGRGRRERLTGQPIPLRIMHGDTGWM
jgi:hypothetical protein